MILAWKYCVRRDAHEQEDFCSELLGDEIWNTSLAVWQNPCLNVQALNAVMMVRLHIK
jgi:hypothetical protein